MVRENRRALSFCDHAGQTGVDTDQDKLLARLESDLKESQQLVRLQQQLLQVPQLSIPQSFQR